MKYRPEELKDIITRERGYWGALHEGLMQTSPAFLEAYYRYVAAPWTSNHLSPATREMIYIAADGSVSHLYTSGMRRHMDHALALGANDAEVLQVVLLTTACASWHSHQIGMPALEEELRRSGAALPDAPADPERSADEAAYRAAIGALPPWYETLTRIAPAFAGACLNLMTQAWTAGPLPVKIKEFIALAVCAAPTHLFAAGVREHTARALAAGATPGEISEVLQLTSAIAVHTSSHGVPDLLAARSAAAQR